jgi:hypothetical protein
MNWVIFEHLWKSRILDILNDEKVSECRCGEWHHRWSPIELRFEEQLRRPTNRPRLFADPTNRRD